MTVESESLFFIASVFFFVTNPIGNAPAILAMIKDFDFQTQMRIVVREVIAALFVALFFQFFGDFFFSNLLDVKTYTTSITGGILLFLLAFDLIFPQHEKDKNIALTKEPFIVPIATPILAGPGLLTMVMLYASQQSALKVSSAILIAWVGVSAILLITPLLKQIMGKRGMVVLEQLMGMLLSMMSIEMIVKGLTQFIRA